MVVFNTKLEILPRAIRQEKEKRNREGKYQFITTSPQYEP
jgi:hypothetical protein